MLEYKDQTYCCLAALLGAPNAGKSSLVNKLVGQKVSIVTPKVQTTRVSLRGVCTRDRTQIILVDTPGIFQPKRTLEKAIVQNAWQSILQMDWLLLVVDAQKGICSQTINIIDTLKNKKQKAVLVLNKIDTILPGKLLPLTQELNDSGVFEHTFMLSALKGDGVDDLKRFLAEHAPKGPWLFPANQHTDSSDRTIAEEITREQLFLTLDQELPYSIAVETEKYEENAKGELIIHQAIYVLREQQKPIVLGKSGARIKQISTASRKAMARALGRKVHLFLFVKVKQDWTEKSAVYNSLGLEFPG